MSLGRVLLLAASALLAAWALLGFPHPLPTSEDQLNEIFRSLGAWTYALAGAMTFLELGTPVGLVAPTELAVPFAGAAAAAGSVQLMPLICVVWICAVTGDSVNYLTGRILGRGAVERHGSRVRITQARLRRIDGWFARHGRATVVLGRFGIYVRTLTPFLAGAARMPYRRFLAASLAGSGLWAAALCGLGYIAFDSLALVADLVRAAGIGVGLATMLGLIAAATRAHHRRSGSASGKSPRMHIPLRPDPTRMRDLAR